MAGQHLRKRQNWQKTSGVKASAAEGDIVGVLEKVLDPNIYRVEDKPKDLKHIYENVELTKDELEAIFTPDREYIHGIVPDCAIKNKITNKVIYIEIKRQDGWVEGKTSNAGRGNAHERSNKFFTPGLLEVLREYTKILEPHLPFAVIFMGDITRDPKRVREVTLWYGSKKKHFFMWRDKTDLESLENYITSNILPLLD